MFCAFRVFDDSFSKLINDWLDVPYKSLVRCFRNFLHIVYTVYFLRYMVRGHREKFRLIRRTLLQVKCVNSL